MIYILLFLVIVFLKVIFFSFYILNPQSFFSGGNDADYYDAYAKGADYPTSSIWPDFLRILNDLNVYSREGVSFILMLIGVVAIPILVGRLSMERKPVLNVNVCLVVPLIISFYPTLFYYTLDIYRDVFMLFLFILGLAAVKVSIDSPIVFSRILASLTALAIGGLLYLFRGYLGFSFLLSFFCFSFVRFRNFSFFGYVLPMLIVLNSMFAMGLLKPLLAYRDLFNEIESNTNLGIRFDSVPAFIPDFLHSFFSQLLGFFYPNAIAVFLFLIESVPFFLALIYVVKNRRHSNKFIDFIVVFFIAYSTIWLLGNDNLGTAMRLRMYNYVGILIACAIIYQRKNFYFRDSLDEQKLLSRV